MKTTDYTTTILVDQTAGEVFSAITNVSGWWQGAITGNTKNLNDEFEYRMKEFHFSKQKIVELIPNIRIVWDVTESKLNFISNKSEWAGTKIIFEIEEMNYKTQLRFTHEGLVPSLECYGGCSGGWQKLIHESLVNLITTGQGKNVFGE